MSFENALINRIDKRKGLEAQLREVTAELAEADEELADYRLEIGIPQQEYTQRMHRLTERRASIATRFTALKAKVKSAL